MLLFIDNSIPLIGDFLCRRMACARSTCLASICVTFCSNLHSSIALAVFFIPSVCIFCVLNHNNYALFSPAPRRLCCNAWLERKSHRAGVAMRGCWVGGAGGGLQLFRWSPPSRMWRWVVPLLPGSEAGCQSWAPDSPADFDIVLGWLLYVCN